MNMLNLILEKTSLLLSLAAFSFCFVSVILSYIYGPVLVVYNYKNKKSSAPFYKKFTLLFTGLMVSGIILGYFYPDVSGYVFQFVEKIILKSEFKTMFLSYMGIYAIAGTFFLFQKEKSNGKINE